MKVRVPTNLRSYTDERAEVEAGGGTVGEVLADLDRRFPGFRFRIIDEQDRIRRHINLFVETTRVMELDAPVAEGQTLTVICALSGG